MPQGVGVASSSSKNSKRSRRGQPGGFFTLEHCRIALVAHVPGRRGGQRMTTVAPLEPLAKMIADFQQRGGVIWACPPCVQARGYEQSDLLDGVTIVGASAMHAQIKEGAATLSF